MEEVTDKESVEEEFVRRRDHTRWTPSSTDTLGSSSVNNNNRYPGQRSDVVLLLVNNTMQPRER
jgi:hypothetical protein